MDDRVLGVRRNLYLCRCNRVGHNTCPIYACSVPARFRRRRLQTTESPVSHTTADPNRRLFDPSRFRNPDNDPRGPWLASETTSPGDRPNLIYEWSGQLPPLGRHWRYSRERMQQLHEEGRLHYLRNGRPTLKRYLAEVSPEPEPELPIGYDIGFIVRRSMVAIAYAIARDPTQLDHPDLEWRDLERVLREVFEGLGFATKLTRPAKDGGFDLEISVAGHVYLVEVKLWSQPSVVGDDTIDRFAEVVVNEQAERGLLLSRSGFSKKALSGRVEIEQHVVALGDGSKIVSLCQGYIRKAAGIWMPSACLPGFLFANTL